MTPSDPGLPADRYWEKVLQSRGGPEAEVRHFWIFTRHRSAPGERRAGQKALLPLGPAVRIYLLSRCVPVEPPQ
jgi:hypothetical protein